MEADHTELKTQTEESSLPKLFYMILRVWSGLVLSVDLLGKTRKRNSTRAATLQICSKTFTYVRTYIHAHIHIYIFFLVKTYIYILYTHMQCIA